MVIDILFLIVVFLSFYYGFQRGIIKTLFSIAALLIAILATFKLSPITVHLLEKTNFIDSRFSILLGFALTFMGVYWVIRLLGSSLEKGLKTLHINFLNKLSGSVLFGLLSIVIFSYTIFLCNQLQLISSTQKKTSTVLPYLQSIPENSRQIATKIKPFFKSFWDQTAKAMDEIKSGEQE